MQRGSYLVLLLAGFAMPPLLPETRCALTAPFHPYPSLRSGGLFSVALSLRLPSPDVIRRHFLLEPGLSSLLRAKRYAGRSPGHLAGCNLTEKPVHLA